MKLNRIAILLTCYNRVDSTLACLKYLYDQNLKFDVYLVDDGSTDGTSESIKVLYPDVNLISGSGDLFWNRGMHLAWKEASFNLYDFYIWLNDDTLLFDSAIHNVLSLSERNCNNSIVCGAIRGISNNDFTYGGKDHNLNPIFPNSSNTEVVFMNGNFVLIPRTVFELVGNLDPVFHHDLGDYDYGLRARRLGIRIITTESFVGCCERNELLATKGRKVNLSLFQRFRRLYSPFGYHPIQQFVFHFRHSNFFYALYIFLKLNIVNLFSDKFYFRFIKR